MSRVRESSMMKGMFKQYVIGDVKGVCWRGLCRERDGRRTRATNSKPVEICLILTAFCMTTQYALVIGDDEQKVDQGCIRR